MKTPKWLRLSLWLGLVGVLALHALSPSPQALPEVVAASNSGQRVWTDTEPTRSQHSGSEVQAAPVLIARAALYPAPTRRFRDLFADGIGGLRTASAGERRPIIFAGPGTAASDGVTHKQLAPYAFAGRVVDGTTVRAVLNRADRSYAAAVGEVLDDEYRLDAIEEQQVRITHIPTGLVHVWRAADVPR
jgi:hypothetical protein